MSDKVNWDEFTPVGQPASAAKTPAVDWSQFEVAKPSGALRKAVGDKALGFASGAVGATKALADVAGAGNVVSNTLEDVNKGINDYLSPEAKADQQEQSSIMAGAAGKGTWEGIKAGAKAFSVAPVQTAVQGLGSVVPIIAGTALTGGAAPAAAVGAGIGVAMGAGTAKGAIFDEVKKRGIAKGLTEDQATAEADKAQEYGGANTDQIALGGALGAADALTGVSAAASRMARGALRKPVADAVANTAERGVLARAGMGMLGEMPLEAAQGGQEQVAANLAAQRAGYEAGTWDNVASNATLEALASAGPGAAFGALDTQTKQTTPPVVPPAPVQESGIDPATGTTDESGAAPANGMGYNPDAGQMTQFPDGSQSFTSEVPPVEPAKPSEAMGLDPAAGPMSAAAVTAVDAGVTQEIQASEASAADQAAYEQAAQSEAEQAAKVDTIDKPITSGPLAEAAMSDEDKRAILFSNKAVADGGNQYEGTQDGDILNGMGKPYSTRFAAQRRARMEGKDWAIATVFDGFVARRKDAKNGAIDTPAGLAKGADEPASNQPRGSGVAALAEPIDGRRGNVQGDARLAAGNGPADPVPLPGAGPAAVKKPQNQPQDLEPSAKKATESVATEAPEIGTSANLPPAAESEQSSNGDLQTEAANVQNPAPTSQPEARVAPDQDAGEAPQAVASGTATPAGVSAAGSVAVEGGGVAQPVASFARPLQAQAFIGKNGLKETHQSVKTASGWDVVPKDSQPQGSINAQTPETIQSQSVQEEAPRADLTDAQRAQVADANAQDFEALYQADIKNGIKRRLGKIKPAEADQKKTPFKSFLREYGIAPTHTSDIAGSNRMRANNVLPATFRANGLGLDALVERAIERGFMTEADRGDQGKLIAMIQSEIAGEQQVSSEFATEDAAAQTERVQRREIEGMADELSLPFDADTSTDRLASMVARIDDRLKNEPRGTTKAQRIIARAKETIARIERKRAKYEAELAEFASGAISEQDAVLEMLHDDEGNPMIVRASDIAVVEAWLEENQQWDNGYGTDTGTNQDSGQIGAPVAGSPQASAGDGAQVGPQAQPGSPEAQAGQPEGLTAPTRADVLAQQDAVEKAEKDKAKADKDAEAKAKAERVAKEIASRQEASADNFQLGQSAEDSLAGQGSVFDVAAEPEAKVEQRPETFIKAPDGSLNFGEITPEMSKAMRRQAGKIRLRQGNDAWGLTHIENRHAEQFRNLGYESVSDFVASVAGKFDAIYQRTGSALDVVIQDGDRGRLMVQLEREESGDFYDVKTASPIREDQFKNKKPLWERTGTSASTASEDNPPSPKGQNGGRSVAQPAAESKAAKIEDSGEVLEGARKLYAKSYAAKLDEGTGMDTAAVPLSKSWPEPDYQRLIDEGADPWAVAMARAMRDEVPTKPSSSWKLKGWVQKVEALRDMTAKVMSGEMTKEKFKTTGGQFNLADWFNKIDLYEAVGHATSLKNITFKSGAYSFYAGQAFSPPKNIWVVHENGSRSSGSWGKNLAEADTKAEAIEKFKVWSAAQVGAPPATAKATSFDIYSYRSKPNVFIVGKRISSAKSVDLKEFPTAKEARAYVAANQAELERLLTEAKFEPSERGESNAPRVGADHRNGADVTTEQFRDTFGFRGEQFGASMPQGERQANMNQAYDALMDLAGVIGIPPKALSLNGELGLAFGARGVGGKNPAAAHYERDTTGAVTPNRVVINLTRKNGAGSLAHEWFHAADNYFARMRGEKAGMLTESYASRGEGVRPEMVTAFKQLMAAINISGMRERSKQLDKKRVKDYWSTGLEMAARSFESYVIAKLQDKNGANDYLANIVPEELYTMQGSYPYPVMGEMPAIRAAFDNFFDAVQTKETEQGVAMFSAVRVAKSAQSNLTQEAVEKIVASALKRVVGAPVVEVFADPVAAGQTVPDGIIPKGATLPDGRILVFVNTAESVIDVAKTVFHELFHRGSKVRFTTNQAYIKTMLDIAAADVAVQKLVKAWKNTDDGKSKLAEFEEKGPLTGARLANFEALAVEEALAQMTESVMDGEISNPQGIMKSVARFLGKVMESWGMGPLALWLRQQSMTNAERFILETVRVSGGVANRNTTSLLFSSTKNASAVGRNSWDTRVGQAVQSTQDALKNATVTDLLKQFGNRLSDFRGLGLQTLGRRQLVDIYGKDLPAMVPYSDMVAQMEADKNESGAEADGLATDWGKLKDERQLAELMHDATLAQIDPDKPAPPAPKTKGHESFDALHEASKHRKLKEQFDKLTDEAKAAYRTARDMYSTHNEKVRQAIQERIMRSELSSAKKAALLERMDGEFFQKVKGVYFPLARFGQYVTVVKDAGGNVVSANRSETMNEAEATRKVLQEQFPASGGFKVGKVLKDREFNAARDGVGRGFMADLFETLEKTGAGDELMDSISQLYLAALPDLSWAKHGIHRKGTPGFSQDARRAFAQNMFHGARYLAKLRYADQLQSGLDTMQEHIAKQSENEAYDSVKAQQVVDEMVKRHESLMNPASNPLSTALTSVGFVFHLGLSPASALVNLSQTALVALPIMGAKWGFTKSSAALLLASKQAAGNKNDISSVLNTDERKAYDEAVRRGVIDVTMAHDLAGIAQGEDSKVSAAFKPVMKYASFLFHHAEKFNRQVTFVAAYRLARAAGTAQETAFDDAVKATYDGHFDYGAANRPRLMQGNVARVVFLFKQYSQNMIYTLTRNAQQAIKAETPEGRAEARKALSGLLVSHAMAAGVFGLPMVGMLLSAASAIGGDEDEPWDAKVALQNMLADSFGPKAAEVFAHGLSRLTPWDISGRVGLDKLLLPDVQEGLEGTRAAESWVAQAAGPVIGIGVNMAKGLSEMGKGEYQRGLESMLPSALRGPMKAWRFGTEGNVDKTGVSINDEVSAAGVAGQALGFSPSETRLAQEGKSAIYSADKAIQTRRTNLVRQYALAAIAEDEDGKIEAREDIDRFNEKNPSARILHRQLLQSVMNRRKRMLEAEQGVYLPPKRQGAMEAGRFALVE